MFEESSSVLFRLIVAFACGGVVLICVLVGAEWQRDRREMQVADLICRQRDAWDRLKLADKEATLFPVRIVSKYGDARSCLLDALCDLRSQVGAQGQLADASVA
jgi:hypothetical protein